MEQNKWIMVRRETTFEKFKRKIKDFIFNFFGIEILDEENNQKLNKKSANNTKLKENKINDKYENNKEKSEIVVEIIS